MLQRLQILLSKSESVPRVRSGLQSTWSKLTTGFISDTIVAPYGSSFSEQIVKSVLGFYYYGYIIIDHHYFLEWE